MVGGQVPGVGTRLLHPCTFIAQTLCAAGAQRLLSHLGSEQTEISAPQ